jgi:hypothetical protein
VLVNNIVDPAQTFMVLLLTAGILVKLA